MYFSKAPHGKTLRKAFGKNKTAGGWGAAPAHLQAQFRSMGLEGAWGWHSPPFANAPESSAVAVVSCRSLAVV